MKKSNKAFFIIILIISIYIDTFFVCKSILFYELNKNLLIHLLYILTPLVILLIIYFLFNMHNSIELSINYWLFIFSFLLFASIILYYICYAFLIIYNFNTVIVFWLSIISAILLLLSFHKNFEINVNIFKYLKYILISFYFIVLQFLFLAFLYFLLYEHTIVTNPNRYEFVKYHFYSPSELTSFPKEIPKNALNVSLQYTEYSDSVEPYNHKCIWLDFDIKTPQNKIQHFKYTKEEYYLWYYSYCITALFFK